MANITIATIATIISTNRAAMDARREKHYEVHGEPTVGKDRRLHAPHDGYIWGDQAYLGGQYLPENTDFFVDPNRDTVRIKIVESLKATIDEFATFGKSWTDKAGRSCCYAYLSVTSGEKSQIEPLLPENGKRLISVEAFGNPDHVKTWKHSTPKLVTNIARKLGGRWLDNGIYDIICHELDNLGIVWAFDDNAKTDCKISKAHDFYGNPIEGKQVRYEYLDDLITE